MTITLNPHEIETWRNSAVNWSIRRAEFTAGILVQPTVEHADQFIISDLLTRELTKWDKENPFPGLVPAILGSTNSASEVKQNQK